MVVDGDIGGGAGLAHLRTCTRAEERRGRGLWVDMYCSSAPALPSFVSLLVLQFWHLLLSSFRPLLHRLLHFLQSTPLPISLSSFRPFTFRASHPLFSLSPCSPSTRLLPCQGRMSRQSQRKSFRHFVHAPGAQVYVGIGMLCWNNQAKSRCFRPVRVTSSDSVTLLSRFQAHSMYQQRP